MMTSPGLLIRENEDGNGFTATVMLCYKGDSQREVAAGMKILVKRELITIESQITQHWTIGIKPPHDVDDVEKLKRLVKALESGATVPPIVVLPDGLQAICGSHRIAAAIETDSELTVLRLSEAELEAAMGRLGAEPEDWDALDWNDLCETVAVATGGAIAKALAGQYWPFEDVQG